MSLMNLTKIAGIITALAVIIGTAWSLDSRWAYRADFEKYQAEQSLDKTTDRLWDTQDRLKKKPQDEELQKRERELIERKRRIEMDLKQLDKGGK